MAGRLGRISLVVIALILAACGGDSDQGGPASSTSAAQAATPSTTAVPTASSSTSTPSSCSHATVERPSLYALSASDGSLCWTAFSDANAFVAAVAGGRVLVDVSTCPLPDSRSQLVALDPATGEELWRVGERVGADYRSLGAGDGIVVRNLDAGVAAFDVADGRMLWDRDGVFASVDGPDYVVVAEDPGDAPSASAVMVLDRRTGEERWRVDLDGELLASVAATTEVVAVGGPETATAYGVTTGERRWEAPVSLSGWTARADAGDVILTTDARVADGEVTGLDAATGAELWAAPGSVTPTPPNDENVYLDQVPGGVVAVDAWTGARRWSLQSSGVPEAGPGLVVAGVLELTGGRPVTIEAIDPATGMVRWSRNSAEIGLPSSSTPSYGQSIPSSAGVFSGFVHCGSA